MTILNGETYTANQKRLRDWFFLEEIKLSLSEAVKLKDREKTAESLCLYVSTAFHLDKSVVDSLPWKEIALAFNDSCMANIINLHHIAFIRTTEGDLKQEAWDYDGRAWWTWAHVLAKEFGWSIEYISDLFVSEAFALLQEILLDQQFTREWEWTISEYSTKYNSTTKKSDPNPLPRPKWMTTLTKEMIEEPKIVRIPKGMLPVGNIISHKDSKS